MPTVDTLFEDGLANGEEIHWHTECGLFHCLHDASLAAQTRGLVRQHVRLPDLRFIFGYAPANLTLVEIRP